MRRYFFLKLALTLIVTGLFCSKITLAQTPEKPMVITAYYMGDGNDITNYKTNELTHIIFCFLHLKGNQLVVDNVNDSLAITKLVSLKKTNPDLKIILSLGGWGGCPGCSQVFSSDPARQEFAQSVLQLFINYHVDGLDLDWEYPAIESVAGHRFKPEDKQNFTYLIKLLRQIVGQDYELSFAAGGFEDYLTGSVEWNKVMPEVNYVNLMTYDLVNGNSRRTGHLTPLYSTPEQSESTDFAVKFLDSIGVPMNKVVIGMAFYARLYNGVVPENNGLYQKARFSGYIAYRDQKEKLGSEAGYTQYWDKKAKAPYAYNESTGTFATYDNVQSVYYKTKYARSRKLAGVMFWELRDDMESGGLLDMIYEVSKEKE
jgi:chitinase